MSSASIKHLAPTQVELEITISREEFEDAREQAFRNLVSKARIPGFRLGKAPRKLFESHYGTAAIEERAMETLVPNAYRKAVQDNGLQPVERPQMELLPDEAGEPLRVRATVAVCPQFEPHDYKGVELTVPSVAISAEDVEAALERLRADATTLVPVERPVAFGDTPTIDYEGAIEGIVFEGGCAQGRPTEIVEDRFIPGFASGVVGMRAGETKAIEARFPDQYTRVDLAGKTARFTVTVQANAIARPAALDDALAERFRGQGATLESLRSDLRARLEANADTQRQRALRAALLEHVSATHDIALPDVLVEREEADLEREVRDSLERAGIEWQTYLAEQGKTPAAMRAEHRLEAVRRVKVTLLLEAIARAEKITATNAEIETEIAQLAGRHGRSREAILETLQGNLGPLVEGIVRAKTLDFLLANAKVHDVAPAVAGPAAERQRKRNSRRIRKTGQPTQDPATLPAQP